MRLSRPKASLEGRVQVGLRQTVERVVRMNLVSREDECKFLEMTDLFRMKYRQGK